MTRVRWREHIPDFVLRLQEEFPNSGIDWKTVFTVLVDLEQDSAGVKYHEACNMIRLLIRA